MRNTLALPLSVVFVLTLVVAPVSAEVEPGPCGAPAAHPGGDWPPTAHDLANTRSQPLEDTIGPDTVGDLEVAWAFDLAEHGGGELNNTPIVANGCVFLGDGRRPRARARTPTRASSPGRPSSMSAQAGFGGASSAAPAVWGTCSSSSSTAAAARTSQRWTRPTASTVWTTVIDETPASRTRASSSSAGWSFIGHSGNRATTPTAQGGFVILDAEER
jgi:hypothetical protein